MELGRAGSAGAFGLRTLDPEDPNRSDLEPLRDTETRAAALAALRADLAARLTEGGGDYRSATWLVEARRG